MENIEISIEVNKQYFVEILGYRTHLDLYTVEEYFRNCAQSPPIKSGNILSIPRFKKAIRTADYHYSQDDYTGMLVGIKILRSYTIPIHHNSDSTLVHQKFFDTAFSPFLTVRTPASFSVLPMVEVSEKFNLQPNV